MVCLRRHFVPNPVQRNYCRRGHTKPRRHLFIHTQYDANGNRQQGTLPSGISSPTGAGNRLLYDGDFYYTYDAAGNRTAKYHNTYVDGNGVHDRALDEHATDVTTYTWDNANRLTSVTSAGTTINYSYDAFGRMVSRSDAIGTENYVYDGENLALVLNADGQVTERELYGPAVDMILASEVVSATSTGEGGAQAAGTVSWMLTDNQGSVRDVVRLNGSLQPEVVDHVIYDAYGNAAKGAVFADAALPRFGLNGMRRDAATGLNVTEYRFYDPATGNWLSQDPIGFGGGDTNTSRFCGNSPTNFVDPSGLDWKDGFWHGVWQGISMADPAPALVAEQIVTQPTEYYYYYRQGTLGWTVNGPISGWEFSNEQAQDLNAGNYRRVARREFAGVFGSMSVGIYGAPCGSYFSERFYDLARQVDPRAAKQGRDIGEFGTAVLGFIIGLRGWCGGGAVPVRETPPPAEPPLTPPETPPPPELPAAQPGATAPGAAGDGFTGRFARVNPNKIGFSQRTAGGSGRAAPLRESMAGGWNGPAIDAVETPNGLVTIDNTRVAIAQELGISEIPVKVRLPSDPLPPSMLGRFGSAKTWGEALIQRTGNQRPPLPPGGTMTRPRLP